MTTDQTAPAAKPVMKPAAWIGLAIILASLCFGAKSFVSNLTPYVSFTDARNARSAVQVMGALDKASIVDNARDLAFTIISPDGQRMPVRFKSAKPGNFEQAVQVTAIGTYDGQVFRADNLLVKCPSKYQGKEGEQRSYPAAG